MGYFSIFFRYEMMGKTVDHDSAYGCQCWDGYMDYCLYNGMHVQYDGFVKREGYCWISWIGSDNSRRWMACGELNSRGYNTTPYGVFK